MRRGGQQKTLLFQLSVGGENSKTRSICNVSNPREKKKKRGGGRKEEDRKEKRKKKTDSCTHKVPFLGEGGEREKKKKKEKRGGPINF